MHFWDAGSTDEDSGSAGRTFHKRFSRPTIELDRQQNINQIKFNNQVRSSQPFTSDGSTREVYRALKLFNTIAYQQFSVKYKLSDGDLAVFDNLRVMHGREGYTVTRGQQGDRLLRGCYIDWDEIMDRINVLTKVPLV